MKDSSKNQIVLFMIGVPGAGKSYFARQWSNSNGFFHLSADRIRKEITDSPSFSDKENQIVENIHDYMYEALLESGSSIVIDSSMNKRTRRTDLRKLADKYGAKSIVVWVQTDYETALLRSLKKDRRNPDDKFSAQLDKATFQQLSKELTKPSHEEYVVISGKHVFTNQKNAVENKLRITRKTPVSLGGRVISKRRSVGNASS